MSYSGVEAQVVAILKTVARFRDTYTASTISFDAATSKILDSANGLAWVRPGDNITVSGTALNNGTFTAVTVAAGNVVVSVAPVNEVAGASVALTRPASVTIGDYRVLDRGIAETVVVEPGSFTDEVDQWTLTDPAPFRYFTWDILLNLFERYTPNGAAVTVALSAMRDAIIAPLVAAPNLNDSTLRVQLLSIAADGDPADVVGNNNSGPYFKMQTLRIRIRELDSATAGNT